LIGSARELHNSANRLAVTVKRVTSSATRDTRAARPASPADLMKHARFGPAPLPDAFAIRVV